MDRLDIDKKRAIELGVRYVHNHWNSVIESEIKVSVLSGGYSSRLYIIEDISTSPSNPIKKFLIRLYGGKLVSEDNPIKPHGGEIKETLVFYAVGLAGLGPKLYGSFDGGRVEEFVHSHMLREVDYELRSPLVSMLELARKLARFHSLDLPIAKERHQILDSCEQLHQQRDIEQFRKLANHLGIANVRSCEDFDVSSEIQWLKKVENVVAGRIVTISGDINKNNFLIRDTPDTFGERVMMIDYELCDYRGRDIGQIFIMKLFEVEDGYFRIICDYPDEDWRRLFITENLKETKKSNYFQWDEKLDSVDHVLMEADFFMFHSIQMVVGFFLNQKDDSPFYHMQVDKARSMLQLTTHLVEVYGVRKSNFNETYGKRLGFL